MKKIPVFLFLVAALLSPSPGAQDSSSAAGARALGNAFAEVYEKVAPSVVVLEVMAPPGEALADDPVLDFFFRYRGRRAEPPREEESEGSGIIVREDGYILTNAHVIAGADPNRGVTARLQDGKRLPLVVAAVDEKTDLALLKAEARGLPAIRWGNSAAIRVGELVCAIGAPLQLDFSLTTGVISAKGRGNLTDTVYEDYLQTDAMINPGSSGGPLCDLDGRVIGINTLINGLNRSFGFAIPARIAKRVSDALIESGRVARPWLGIRIETLGKKSSLQQMMGREQGVLVRAIEQNTPAARSDLRPADVIVEVDGKPVISAREVQQAVLDKKIGDKAVLKVWRRGAQGGAYLVIPITTEEFPDSPAVAEARRDFPMEPPAGSSTPPGPFGLQYQNLPPQVADRLGIAKDGVIVTNVEPGSAADVAGIKRRDVITAVGPEAIHDTASFQAALEKLGNDEAAVLQIERNGKKTYAILKR